MGHAFNQSTDNPIHSESLVRRRYYCGHCGRDNTVAGGSYFPNINNYNEPLMVISRVNND